MNPAQEIKTETERWMLFSRSGDDGGREQQGEDSEEQRRATSRARRWAGRMQPGTTSPRIGCLA